MRHRGSAKPKATVDIDGPLTPDLARVIRCYNGSDAEETTALYDDLRGRNGHLGKVATNLLRAMKASARAKIYRGSSVGMAYEKKVWSIDQLAQVLITDADRYGIVWGWQADPAQAYHAMVLYIDLPFHGQASFHVRNRGPGPDYCGVWDGVRGLTAERIIRFAADVLGGVDFTGWRPEWQKSA